MGRASVAAAGFALTGGAEADPAGFVHLARTPDRLNRVLLASVEPIDPSARGGELATVALRVLRETFAATTAAPADALLAAFTAANAAVLAENRSYVLGQGERRIRIGATAVAIAGREITVVQAPPSQAIIVQDGQIYAFPDIASWRGDYLPDTPVAEAHPLGFAEDIVPLVFQSQAASGDLVALCATSVGRVLARDEDAVVDLFGGSLLTTDLEGSVDRLERLLARNDVADGFAVVIAVSRLPRRSRLLPAAPRLRIEAPANGEDHGGSRARLVAAGPSLLPAVSAPLDDKPPALAGLRDGIIELMEVAAPRRRAPAMTYDTRQRALAAPGALSVQRYRDASGLPPEWRANLPRGPGLHVPARLLAVSLVLFLTLGGTGFAAIYQRSREARAQVALVTADAALTAAVENPGMAVSAVAEAEAAIVTARAAGAQGEALDQRVQSLARVRDDVWSVGRLRQVVRIGALPGDLRLGPVGLALAGQTLYLADGDLYELDPDGGRLVALLSRGDPVAGGVTGDLRYVTLNGGHIVVADGEATYTRDAAGRWQRTPLAVADVGGLRPEAPIVSWGDASYGLSWDGNIVRFSQTTGGPIADVWAAADETPDLKSARDLAIDGRIHLLLDDGRTLTFSRGALVGTVSPFVVPALQSAAYLAEAPFANVFYIVDRTARVGENVGRIIRVDASGDTRQLLTPAPDGNDPAAVAMARTLAGAEDVAIDELTGTVYWVSDGEIWRARLPSS
jgi:hypothetical protein